MEAMRDVPFITMKMVMIILLALFGSILLGWGLLDATRAEYNTVELFYAVLRGVVGAAMLMGVVALGSGLRKS